MDRDSPEPKYGDPGVLTELRLLYGSRHCRHCGDNALLVDHTGAGVSGHGKIPISGQISSPLSDKRITHFWTS